MAANFSIISVDISQNSTSIGQYIDKNQINRPFKIDAAEDIIKLKTDSIGSTASTVSGDVFFDSLSPVILIFIPEDLPARPGHNNPTKSANTRIYKSIIKDNRLDRIYEDLKLLVESEYDWEGYGLEKPNHYTILKTKSFISSFLNILDDAGCIWSDPFIYSGEDGCVCLGWSNGNKSLYIYIHSDSLTYRKKLTSVNDIQSEEGDLDNENYISIWNWLIDDE